MVDQASPSIGLGQSADARRSRDRLIAGGVISAHTIEHIYGRGFLVVLTEIHEVLGLAPFQTFFLDGIRSLAAGTTGMSSGLFVDRYRHRTGHILWLAMALMGVGYLLVGMSPTYTVIVLSIMVASAGSALWHPPALALLSHMYPDRRGLLVALHRSTGNIGEAISPIIVWALLLTLSWRGVVSAGVPIIAAIALVIFIFMRNVGGPKPEPERASFRYNFQRKGPPLAEAMRSRGMLTLLAVSAIRGIGDRALILGIPLYLKDEVEMGTGLIAFHVALFTALAIVTGPLIGAASDRIGRKPMVVMVMAVSIVAPLWMASAGEGPGFTGAVALFGALLFSVNSLTQASAMDLAANRGLEGSVIGMMWGIGTLFGFGASLAAGALAGWNWNAVFYFAAGFFALGLLVSLLLPSTSGGRLARPGPSGNHYPR